MQKALKEIEESESTSTPHVQAAVQAALTNLTHITVGIHRESMFSSNEELDDIRSDLLQYLLVPFYQATLVQRITEGDRLKLLERAELHYRNFLNQLERLGRLSKQDRETLAREHTDANTKRAEALERHRRKKQISEHLQRALREHERGEEDSSREHALLTIDDALVDAVGELLGVQQELALLREVNAMREQGHDPLQRRGPARPPQPNVRVLPNGQVVPLDSLSTVARNQRTAVKDAAFVPTNLPSMSLEQFQLFMAERQMADAQRAQAHAQAHAHGHGQPHSANPQTAQLSDSDSDSDDTMRARQWDDWKDDNPRGSGNKGSNLG